MEVGTIILKINNTDQIVVSLLTPLHLMGWNWLAPINFLHNNNLVPLAQHPLYFNILDMRDILLKAINNELNFSPTIVDNIGYFYSMHLKHLISSSSTDFKNEDHIEECHLWEVYDNRKRYSTWIYNKNSNIIFEITPQYPFLIYPNRSDPHHIPFKKWILNYKPYFTATLSHEIAQQWLDTAEYIIKTIDENEARWKREYEEEQKRA
jgi:hypothetical protein